MRGLIFVFVLAVLISNKLGAQESLDSVSLDEVLAIASEHALLAKEAIKDLKIATGEYDYIQSSWKPYLALNATVPNYSKTFQQTVQPNGSIAFQPISQNISTAQLTLNKPIVATGGTIFASSSLQRYDDFSNEFKNYNGSPIRIGLIQPIIGFNNIKWQKRLEPKRFEEANKRFIYQMEWVHNNTVILYFDALLANLEVNIAQQNQINNQKLYDIANERYELGKISENDLLQLELELVRANKDYKSNLQYFRTAYISLLNYIGGYNKYPIALPKVPQDPGEFIVNVPKAIENARVNRHEFARFKVLVEERAMELERVKREFGPSVDLFASLGLSRGSDNLSDIYAQAQQEQQLQVKLNIPILDWGRKNHQVKMRTQEQEFIKHQINQTENDINARIEDKVMSFINLQEELKLAAEVRRVANKRFDISNQSYVLGNISITDLTIAINEKDRAVREYTYTLRNYWRAYYDLRLMTLYDFENDTPIQYSIN